MSRAVFYCGSAGVGKSTLINKITGSDLATVSHLMLKDGTGGVQRFTDPSDPGLGHIDLPGLNSKNFPTRVTEQIQINYPDTQLLAVLVLSRQDGRITSFIDKFHTIKNELVGNEATFAIIWTRDAVVSKENLADIQREYPNACMFQDNEIARIRAFFANASSFKRQNKAVANEILTSMRSSSVAARPVPSAGIVTRVPPPPPQPQPFLLGPPPNLLYIKGFHDTVNCTAPSMNLLIEKVLEIKKLSQPDLGLKNLKRWTPEEVKRLTGDSYKHYHLLGDKVVNMLAMHIVYAGGEFDDLEISTDKITSNKAGCAMPLFFDKYLRTAHDNTFGNENGKISTHGATDVVEALLALSLHSGKSGARIFRFMITEFFKLVNMGKLVGK